MLDEWSDDDAFWEALEPALCTPGGLALAAQMAAERSDLGAYSHAIQGAYTGGTITLQAGFKALAWVGYTKNGWIPLWHSPDDEFELVDKSALDRTEEFVWEVMRRLDGEQS